MRKCARAEPFLRLNPLPGLWATVAQAAKHAAGEPTFEAISDLTADNPRKPYLVVACHHNVAAKPRRTHPSKRHKARFHKRSAHTITEGFREG